MILTKNRLKKVRKPIDDDMLDYLKFSHLQPIKEKTVLKTDKETQIPDIRNKIIQTEQIQMNHKATDTLDDLNKMDENEKYILKGSDKSFDNDKQVQVEAHIARKYEPKKPPSDNENKPDGLLGRTVRTGFRLAEYATNTAIVGANLTMALSDALADLTSAPHLSSEEEPIIQGQQNNEPEIVSVHSSHSPPQTINSSSSGVEIVEPVISISSSSRQTPTSSSRQTPSSRHTTSSRHTASSIPEPTSPPQPSSPASSAKTTPRKKSQ